jgi:hypothetical protein
LIHTFRRRATFACPSLIQRSLHVSAEPLGRSALLALKFGGADGRVGECAGMSPDGAAAYEAQLCFGAVGRVEFAPRAARVRRLRGLQPLVRENISGCCG